jgi:type IV pilus assembly protein PilP
MTHRGTILILILLALPLGACGEETPRAERGMGGGEGGGDKKPAAEGEGEEEEAKAPVPTTYKDEDFVESEKNRDPFRTYIGAFRTRAPEVMQRRVVMPTTAVEEMELIAIIGGIPQPKAMLVDPMGVGHVVERGDYVGRPKVVQATGSVSMTLNWRVDRIRSGEIVLTQLDPTDPTRPALTRVMPLHETVAAR